MFLAGPSQVMPNIDAKLLLLLLHTSNCSQQRTIDLEKWWRKAPHIFAKRKEEEEINVD